MELWVDTPAKCRSFIIVSPDIIFAGVGPLYDWWGREYYVVYWYYLLCEPLDNFYIELEVLHMQVLETLWAPLLSPFNWVA